MFIVNGPAQLGEKTYYRLDKVEEDGEQGLEFLRYPFAIFKELDMAEKVADFLNKESKEQPCNSN